MCCRCIGNLNKTYQSHYHNMPMLDIRKLLLMFSMFQNHKLSRLQHLNMLRNCSGILDKLHQIHHRNSYLYTGIDLLMLYILDWRYYCKLSNLYSGYLSMSNNYNGMIHNLVGLQFGFNSILSYRHNVMLLSSKSYTLYLSRMWHMKNNRDR